MKILHIVKSEPSVMVKNIITTQSGGNDVKVIDLSQKEISYEAIIDEIDSADKVMSW
jgi:hypothetical protein